MYYVSISTLFTVFLFIIDSIAGMHGSVPRAECGTGQNDSSIVIISVHRELDDPTARSSCVPPCLQRRSAPREVKEICLAVLIPKDGQQTSTPFMVTSSTCTENFKHAKMITFTDSAGNVDSFNPDVRLRENLAVLQVSTPFTFTERVRPACLPGDHSTAIPDNGYMYTISESGDALSKTDVTVNGGSATATEPRFWASNGGRNLNLTAGAPYLVYDQAQQRHTLWGVGDFTVRSVSANYRFMSIPAQLTYIKQLMRGRDTGWDY